MSKILTVFGATGLQGGSVVKAVLADPELSKEFKLRAVTRDVSKPEAKALADQGAEVVAADLFHPDTVARAVQGAHTVFLVTDFWKSGASYDNELAHGKTVSDACEAAGVRHLIYSSLIHVTSASGGRLTHVRHFDAKHDVEQHMRRSGTPVSIVQPGFYMVNFPRRFLRKEEEEEEGGDTYVMTLPVAGDKAKIPVLDTASDLGKFVKVALKKGPGPSGQGEGDVLLAAAEYLTPDEVVAQFQEVTGRKAAFRQVPADVFKSFLPAPAADELTENMLLLEDPGYYAGADLQPSLDRLAAVGEKATTFREYVAANADLYEWA